MEVLIPHQEQNLTAYIFHLTSLADALRPKRGSEESLGSDSRAKRIPGSS